MRLEKISLRTVFKKKITINVYIMNSSAFQGSLREKSLLCFCIMTEGLEPSEISLMINTINNMKTVIFIEIPCTVYLQCLLVPQFSHTVQYIYCTVGWSYFEENKWPLKIWTVNLKKKNLKPFGSMRQGGTSSHSLTFCKAKKEVKKKLF